MSFEGTMNVPVAPSSRDRLCPTRRGYALYGPRALENAAVFDEERTFDRALRFMLQEGFVNEEAIASLAWRVTLADFISARTGFWTEMAKTRLNMAIRLWGSNGKMTDFSHEVWRLFRMRMRREGALARIIYGDISRPKQRAARKAA